MSLFFEYNLSPLRGFLLLSLIHSTEGFYSLRRKTVYSPLYFYTLMRSTNKKTLWLLVLMSLATTLGLYGCKKGGRGAAHPVQAGLLELLAQDTRKSPAQKFHEVAQTMSQLVNEAISMPTDAEMVSHLSTFASQNREALQALNDQLGAWQRNMTAEERTFFMIELLSRDYISQMSRNVPILRQRLQSNPTYLAQFESLYNSIQIKR